MEKNFFGVRFYSDGKLVNPKQLGDILRIDEEAYAVYKWAKSNYDVANVLGFMGGFLAGYPVGTAIAGGESKWGLAAAGGALILLSLPASYAFKMHAKKAVQIYNGKPVSPVPAFYFKTHGMGAKLTLTW